MIISHIFCFVKRNFNFFGGNMLEVIKNTLWSLPCGILVILSGTIILIKTRFFILRHPLNIFRETLGKMFKDKKAFALMCTSLGGTIGVGNAVGVAGAIAEGGAGAVFWMGIAGIFSMAIKYAEIYLAVLFKARDASKGPLPYLQKTTGGSFIPFMYSFLCITVSIGMGNLSQMKAGLNASRDIIPLPQYVLALILTLLFIIVSVGGIKKISSFSKYVVPVIALTYIVFLLGILFFERQKIPSVITEIASESGVISGIKWHLIKSGVAGGFSKSVFSTEAGLGSAGFTHAESENAPHAQALWGVVEVFVDTLICLLTAFAILALDDFPLINNSAFATRAVFEVSLGKFGAIFYSFSMIMFAFTSVVCWYFIGTCGVKNITQNKKATALYFVSFVTFMIISAFISDSVIIYLSDFANALMMIVNLPAVLILVKNLKSN